MMFVIAIEDSEKAKAFLEAVQRDKVVGYAAARDSRLFKKVPVTFIYVTDPQGTRLTDSEISATLEA